MTWDDQDPTDLHCFVAPSLKDEHRMRCVPMSVEERHAHTHPWWWWFACGLFAARMLWHYGGERPLEVATAFAIVGVAAAPILRFVRAWNARALAGEEGA
jgi:hypothetical protein